MPVNDKKDEKGNYYQFGRDGSKYYYKPDSQRSKTMAFNKSKKQGEAISISKKQVKESEAQKTHKRSETGLLNSIFN